MKTIYSIIFAVSMISATVAKPTQEIVPVKLGAKAFKDGDVIKIDEVRSTSPNLEQGDTVTIKGNYRLESRDAASLQLLLTQIEGNGLEESDKQQLVNISSGFKPFEVTITIKHKGYLHLTLYDTKSGKPFGGTYFGTAEQMDHASGLSVSHYLK